MSQTMCTYHKDRIAVDKCERCQRPICLDAKRIYRKRHTRGHGKYRSSYTTRHVYCPFCHADVATNDASGFGAIMGSLFFIIIGLFVTMGFAAAGGPLAIFPLAIVGFGIYQMIQRNKKAEDARQDEKRFLNSLNNKPEGIIETGGYSKMKAYSRPDKVWKNTEVSCFNCGSKIMIDSNYCMDCGDPTDEELRR